MSVSALDQEGHIAALAANLPSGRLWASKFSIGSNLRGLLAGFAPTFRRMDSSLQRYADQNFAPETEDFIAEWEKALGIPDDCFKVASTLAGRQLAVKIKLINLRGTQTEQDFIDIGALFGLTITVNSGIEHLRTADADYGTKLPEMLIGDFSPATLKSARFTMVVVETFPANIQFPWPFTATGLLFATEGQNTLRCLIEKLSPANVDVAFLEAP